VKTRWGDKVKVNADRTFDRYKARWVAKGYSQVQRVNYEETFMPVIHLKNLCYLLTYTNVLNLKIHQMDVELAFLYAHLKEEVYCTQPEGFELAKHPDYVCRLQKSLYSLKQASHEWNQVLDVHL
jgi:hypothetical protein